jgi:hypothetical protein
MTEETVRSVFMRRIWPSLLSTNTSQWGRMLVRYVIMSRISSQSERRLLWDQILSLYFFDM